MRAIFFVLCILFRVLITSPGLMYCGENNTMFANCSRCLLDHSSDIYSSSLLLLLLSSTLFFSVSKCLWCNRRHIIDEWNEVESQMKKSTWSKKNKMYIPCTCTIIYIFFYGAIVNYCVIVTHYKKYTWNWWWNWTTKTQDKKNTNNDNNRITGTMNGYVPFRAMTITMQ